MTHLISRADAIAMAVDVETPRGGYARATYVEDLEALPSADRNILDELQRRFEEEEHKAFENDKTGLKEHVVWNRAIRILEEYME